MSSKWKSTLGAKLTLLVILSSITLAFVAIAVSYQVHCNTEDKFYKELVRTIGQTTAAQLNPATVRTLVDAVNNPQLRELADKANADDDDETDDNGAKTNIAKWLTDNDLLQTCLELQVQLETIRTNMEVEFLYLQTQRGDYSIVLVDPSEELSTFGKAEKNEPEFKDVTRNMRVDATVSNGEYGWLCSGYEVVKDDEDEPIAMVGVDISMEDVMAQRHKFLGRITIEILALMVVIALGALLYIRWKISKPLYELTRATEDFMDDIKETLKPPMELSIRTGDEIETLYEAIRQMEIDINEYMVNLTTVTAEKERIGTELNVATRIQANMLPSIFPPFPERDEFEIFASMTPAKEVGGDLYDFFLLDADHLALVVGDVSGKGVPAALFMVIAKTLLKNSAEHGHSPKDILERVNNQLCENNKFNMFVSAWIGIMEISTGKVTAANAGHEYPAIQQPGGSFQLLRDKHGMVLGGMNNIRYHEYELQLEAGGALYLYTDGVPEATNAAEKLFGTERMLHQLNQNPDAAPETLLTNVKKGIDDFVMDAPQFDDITMLAIRRKR